MFDFKNFDYNDLLRRFSLKNESGGLIVFGLLPLVLGILVFLGFMLFNELT